MIETHIYELVAGTRNVIGGRFQTPTGEIFVPLAKPRPLSEVVGEKLQFDGVEKSAKVKGETVEEVTP